MLAKTVTSAPSVLLLEVYAALSISGGVGVGVERFASGSAT